MSVDPDKQLTSLPIQHTTLERDHLAPTYDHYHADEKKEGLGGNVTVHAADGRDPELIPTEDDLKHLRRIPAGMPAVALAMCLVEFTERASYYGSSGPFNNFINNPLPKGGSGTGAVAKGDAGLNQSAGALGMGSVTTSALVKMFTFLAYVIPIWGGIIADNHWGRFKTIVVGVIIGAVAHVILVIPAIPSIIAKPDASLGTFIISIIILAFAAGFIKPSLGPLLCDQSPVKEPTIAHTKKGERVIVDPSATVERYLLIFYGAINIGSCLQIATQYSARLVGFWLAYLIPGIMYMLLGPLLWFCYPRLTKLPPQGSVIPDVWKVMKLCFGHGGLWKMGRGGQAWWDKAKPSYILERDGHLPESVVWDDRFVDEVRQTFSACGVFALIPIFVLADGGIGNQLNDMSVAMTLNGVPNDVISNFNAISIIVSTPLVTYLLYPFMERIGFPLKPMMRMCIGFLLGSLGCVAAAVIQWRVYKTSPCGYYATTCEEVSPVSLWWQVLPITLPAIGELFVNVTSYEIAYTRSPGRMKGLVYSLALFNSAVGAAISMALSQVIQDPNLIIPWIVLAVISFICAFIFPTYFKNLDHFEFAWSDEEKSVLKLKTDVESPRDDDRY